MAVTSEAPTQGNPTDRFPLLMERAEYREISDHVIDIERDSGASSSRSSDGDSPRGSNAPLHEDRPSTSGVAPLTQSPSSASDRSNSRSPSFTRRAEGLDRRWSPFNTMLWISIELIFTLGQIVAAFVVLSLSTHEKPQTPLFAWVVGYAFGCIASLPLLYWRYLHRNHIAVQESTQNRQGSAHIGSTSESNSYITISLTQSSSEGDGHNATTGTWNGQDVRTLNPRLITLVDHFKMALDCFFAVWFVVGNVWIFGGHTSPSDAPNLYRLCIVFLTFSCIGYALPFILCAMICCCLPCIISFLGVREDMNGKRGASEESINALPTHKFKLKRTQSGSSRESGSEYDEGGLLAAGTEKERTISGEDAACCICLARYADDDELRELPCSHFFHTECVDKWLKINASCPLCKNEIVDTNENSHSPADSIPEPGDH